MSLYVTFLSQIFLTIYECQKQIQESKLFERQRERDRERL